MLWGEPDGYGAPSIREGRLGGLDGSMFGCREVSFVVRRRIALLSTGSGAGAGEDGWEWGGEGVGERLAAAGESLAVC